MKKLLLPVLLAAGLFAGAAQAASNQAEPGPYMGAGIGYSHFNVDGAPSSLDNNGVGFDVFGGYRFNQHMAAEVGYTRMGNMHASVDGEKFKARSEMYTASVLGIMPLNDTLSVYGRVGLAATAIRGGGAHEHETNAVLGIGTEFDITKRVSLRTEVQHLPHFGDSSVGATHVSAGVKVKF